LTDVSIVNVALPDMASSLHSSFTDLQWVIDGYALVLAALVLTAGSIADRVGRRAVYLAGLVLFAASSASCGAASNATILITSRFVQGLGAAMMFATTMALLSNSYRGRDRGIAFGMWGAINGAAAAAGPIVGGLLTTHLGWRWIFFINLPVSVIAVTMTLLVITESRDPQARRVDVPGMVTFTAAAACLTYALIRGDWASARTLALVAATVVALIAFVVIELRRHDPMLDLSLLRNPAFSALLIGGALMSAAAWSAMTYESLWLQSLLGMSAVGAGLVLLPAAGMSLVMSASLGRYTHRIPPGLLIGGGLLVIGAGDLAVSILRSGSGWPTLIAGLTLVGIGAGMFIPPYSSTAMSLVPHQRAGMAAGAATTFRQLGYAFGIAVLGEVFRGAMTRTAGSGISSALSGGGARAIVGAHPELSHTVHEAFASGLDQANLVGAGLAIVAAIAILTCVTKSRTSQPHAPAQAQAPQASAAAAVTEPANVAAAPAE
jgi:EmrB/QacA subfamily drug resistance transporter